VSVPANGHPSMGTLALLAGKDLPWSKRFSLNRHLSGCPDCQAQLRSFQAMQEELRREAESETLTSFEAIADWNRLESEMLGNIAVGVAAARCIERKPKRRLVLRPIFFALAFLGVFVLAWGTHIPSEQTRRIFAAIRGWWNEEGLQTGTVLRSSPSGIAVRAQGTTLIMQHPRSATVALSGGSAVEARFVDETTGQVTITSVYGQ
jgi:anti-sigma factor RsiW